MGLDVPVDCRTARRLQAVALRCHHRHDLAAALDQGTELLRQCVGQCPGLGMDGLGKLGQERRIELVGFGQAPGGFGKITHLARIDNGDRQSLSWLLRRSGGEK